MQRGKLSILSAQNTHSESLKAKHREPKKVLGPPSLGNVLKGGHLYKTVHSYVPSWGPADSLLPAHLVLIPEADTWGLQPVEV